MIWFKHNDMMLPVKEAEIQINMKYGKSIVTNNLTKYHKADCSSLILSNWDIVITNGIKLEKGLLGTVITPTEDYEIENEYFESREVS